MSQEWNLGFIGDSFVLVNDNVILVDKKAYWLLRIIRKEVGKNTDNRIFTAA